MIVSGEEGTQCAVDKTRNQYLVVRGLSFAAGESTGETAGTRKFLFVLYGQGHKVSARYRIFGATYSSQNHGIANRCHHCTVGLFGQFAGLQRDHAAICHLDLFSYDIHLFLFVFWMPFASGYLYRPIKCRAKVLKKNDLRKL